jgi:ubiquinone/menaquinone biosynthesis C-methylase UbiE
MSELPSTYFVYGHHHDKDEMERLTIQDQMITTAMGGVLSEQPDPSTFHHVLDIGCGTGGWVIEAAKAYPEMSLVGIDISNKMIEYASKQAKNSKVHNQVEFREMDTLRQLEFPSDGFDLVNLRFGVSFIRQWDWPRVVSEMLRVTKPGGVVRITDSKIVHQSSSPGLMAFQLLVAHALNMAGHIATLDESGVTLQLAPWLQRFGARQVATKTYSIRCQMEMEAGKGYVEDITIAMRTLRQFILKWARVEDDYEQVCDLVRKQIAQPDFYAVWELITAWAVK